MLFFRSFVTKGLLRDYFRWEQIKTTAWLFHVVNAPGMMIRSDLFWEYSGYPRNAHSIFGKRIHYKINRPIGKRTFLSFLSQEPSGLFFWMSFFFFFFGLFVCLFVCWNKTRKTILRLLCWERSKPPGSDHTRAEAQTTRVPKTAAQTTYLSIYGFVCLFGCDRVFFFFWNPHS